MYIKDHPRVCGKDSAAYNQRMYQMGSPPRMRERLTEFMTEFDIPRITPAYAGKTKRFLLKMPRSRDHPRVCGKDVCLLLPRAVDSGSPPRMRERPFV